MVGVEALTTAQWKQLAKALAHQAPRLRLCFEGTQLQKPVLDFVCPFCQIIELKELKPWEQKQAAVQDCIRLFQVHGKQISPQLAQKFVEYIERIGGGLELEVDKWVNYLGERCEVQVVDIEAWDVAPATHTLWDLFDSLCERRTQDAVQYLHFLIEREVAPQAILSSLRTQTQQHLKMMELIPQGAALVQKAFPYLKGALYERKVRLYRSGGGVRLTALLESLFTAECSLRSNPIYPAYPLERFIFESDR